ncbi:MAG TPA: phosphatase domain-containing protein [Candidatus Acidoferrum sp.]|nr:phosphatase domain-containing protein [Candidatus Acidoferrum sp.]
MTPTNSAEDINKPSGGPVGQPGYIELYSGWATTQKGGFLYGRVHQGKPLLLPEEGDGLEVKLHQTFQDLDLHALSHAQVRLSGFPGAEFFIADDHGFLKVPLPAGIQSSSVGVTVQLETPNYTAARATTSLQVVDTTDPPVGIISDIDDTLIDSGVTHKLKLLKNTFFHNTYDVKTFANAAQAVVAIAGRSASLLPALPVFYLSGSPWALHERISDAFDRLGLPHGAMILRRYSQESLDPYDFKHPHLLEIVDANPGRKWILFGDTGEKDPEVYHTLMQERPGTVGAVFIHNVTDADPQDARFAAFTLFSDWSEVLQASQQRNLGLL